MPSEPSERFYALGGARDRLQDARFTGTRRFRDANGEEVEFKSDAEMAAALKAIETELARLSGRAPASTILFRTSKGV